MKRRIKKGMFLLVLMLTMMLCQASASAREIDQMPDLEPDRKGTLSVTLSYMDENKKEICIPGVTLQVIKTADLAVVNGGSSVYTLTEDFAYSGIDFEGMTASESNEAAKALKSVALNKELQGISKVTDSEGQVLFEELEPGMYLVMQTDNEDKIPLYTDMDPFVVSVPFGKKEDGVTFWQYEVAAEPKVEIISKPRKGTITVTKKTGVYQGNDILLLSAVDTEFYFGIFKDKEGTQPFRDDYIQSIRIRNTSAGTTEFTDLPEGVYYIFETDKDGRPIKPGEMVSGAAMPYTCILEGSETNAVTVDLTSTAPNGTIVFDNVFPELPEGYYLEGEITIRKNVFQGNDRVNVEDTFYAGIFIKENGQYILNEVVELVQNGTVTVPVVLNGDNNHELVEYWIFETDKNGNRVNKDSFSYEVTGEGAVKLNIENVDASIEITNRIKEEAMEETEISTELTHAVRTGDETPILAYAVLSAAALGIMIILVAVQFRKRHH